MASLVVTIVAGLEEKSHLSGANCDGKNPRTTETAAPG